MAARGGADVKQMLLQVDASVELARRNLSQLAAQVQSDSAKMDASLGRVDGATARMGAAFGKIGSLMAGLGLSVGVGTFTALGRQALQFADDLEAAAEQAGINVERYQTLKGALRALEVDGDKADKAFKVLQATLGDVQNGADTGATKALERLGLTSRIMSGEIDSADELLDALAEASKRAGTQAQFTSEIVEIFGRKLGVELASAIADGGAALHQGEADMRAYGEVMTEEMVDRLADANESIDHTLQQASYYFAIFAANAIGSIKEVVDWWSKLGGTLPGKRGSGFGTLGLAIANPSMLGSTIANFSREMMRETTADEILEGAHDRASWAAFGQAFAGSSAVKPKAPRRPGGARKTRRAGGRAHAKKADMTHHSLDSIERDLRPWERIDPRFVTGIENFPDLAKAKEDAAQLTARVTELQGVMSNWEPLPNFKNVLTEEEQTRLEEFTRSFKHDLAGGLADAIVYGEDLGDVLENSLKRAAAAIIESGILELLQQLASAAGFGSSGSGEGGLFSALFSSIGKREGGGPVSARQPYIVGEKRPELFVPHVSGTILPNLNALGRGGPPQRVDVFVHTNDELLQVKVATTAGAVVRMATPGIVAQAASRTMSTIFRSELPSGIG